MFINVITSVIIVRFLSKLEFATYSQTFLIYDLAYPVLTLGIPNVVLYFLPRIKKEEYKSMILNIMFLLFLLSIILSLFLILGGNMWISDKFNNPSLKTTLIYISLYPTLQFPLILDNILVNQNKLKFNIKFVTITSLVLGLSLIFSSMIYQSSNSLVISRILIALIVFPFNIYYSFKFIPNGSFKISLNKIKSILYIAIPLGLATMFDSITRQIGNILVSSTSIPEDYALYAIGAKEVPFIGVITGSISIVIMNELSHKISNEKINESKILFKKSISMSFMFLFPIMMLLILLSKEFIEIIYGPSYIESYSIFMIFLLILPLRSVYFGSVFIAAGKTREILIRSIISLIISVTSTYYLNMFWGSTGAAIGLVLTLYIWTTPYNLHGVKKIFKSKNVLDVLPVKNILSTILISSLSVLPIYIIKKYVVNTNAIIVFTICTILYTSIYILISFLTINEFKQYLISNYYVKKYFKRNNL